MTSKTMKRLSAGEYEYKGYLVRRVENVDGCVGQEWDICASTPGGWVACDRLNTKRACKDMLDGTGDK